jgi:hypothetical protein
MIQESRAAAIDLMVVDDGNQVAIKFDKLLDVVTFTPDQAVSLGVGLIQFAERAKKVKHDRMLVDARRTM